MKKPSFSPLIGALILVCLVLFLPETWLTPFLTKEKVENSATTLNPTMFEGVAIQNKMLENPKYLPIYGSSELSRMDEFHPSRYFLANPHGYTPFLIGRGGTASMYHFLNFATHKQQLKGKKIIFIVSPQWFTKQGEDESHFSSSFSTVKAYQFALHPTVSHAIVVQGSKRMLSYEVVKSDPLLSLLLKANIDNQSKEGMKTKVATVLGKGYLHLLERRDLILSIMDSKKQTLHFNPSIKDKSWEELNETAENIAEKRASNNPFYIENHYYNKMYKAKVDDLKGYKKHQSYVTSPQYQDFQMILDVLKESGAEPLFISIPVNGYWYDYAEFKQKGRNEYYNKIRKQIENEGFPVLDLSHYEYEKYFMTDTMHIGYKGWVQIDKGIEEFMNDK